MSKQDIDTYVGKRLRLRRTMMGLSQEAVAKAVGITFQQVQKYEKGANAMNSNRLYEFAHFMHVPVAYFFDGLEQAGGASGFAEESEQFDHNHKRVSDRESLEMMKAFKRIREQPVRKRLADLVRAIAEHKAILE
ncbi:MAG: helix-turn-helix transcriptional regulator [Pseudomonadota bacterium]|nr:helix-turn-helix transcriptional regulator [Pseudomonadota bacterium]MDE3036887.1 helix-turn-helix transcriptional regulator [Pseudomonadota bacterium]